MGGNQPADKYTCVFSSMERGMLIVTEEEIFLT